MSGSGELGSASTSKESSADAVSPHNRTVDQRGGRRNGMPPVSGYPSKHADGDSYRTTLQQMIELAPSPQECQVLTTQAKKSEPKSRVDSRFRTGGGRHAMRVLFWRAACGVMHVRCDSMPTPPPFLSLFPPPPTSLGCAQIRTR